MPSFQAQLLSFILRQQFKNGLCQSRSHQAVRRTTQQMPVLCPPTVRVVESGAPMCGEWLASEEAPDSRQGMVFYCHGGGYAYGSPRIYRRCTGRLAEYAGVPVFALDYRLAPEHPYPAALDDAEAAYLSLLEGQSSSTIVMGGDSAGGGLVLSLLQRLRDRGAPMPAAAFFYSAWTDLALTGASLEENEANDELFTWEAIARTAGYYVNGVAYTDPNVSPLYGSFTDLPPLHFYASDTEMLRDDTIRTAEKASAQGVETTLSLQKGLPHVWPLFAPLIPEALDTLAETGAFIRSTLGLSPVSTASRTQERKSFSGLMAADPQRAAH